MTYSRVPELALFAVAPNPEWRREAASGARGDRHQGGARPRGILLRRDRWTHRRQYETSGRGVSSRQNGSDPVAGRAAARGIPHHVAEDAPDPFARADSVRPDRAIEAARARLPRRSSRRSRSAFTPRRKCCRSLNRRRPLPPTATIHVPTCEPLVIPAARREPRGAERDARSDWHQWTRISSGLGVLPSPPLEHGDVKPDVDGARESIGEVAHRRPAPTERSSSSPRSPPAVENDPLPIGEWKVNGVQNNPTFKYNPDLFWDANPGPHEGDHSGRTERPGRTRLDRHLEGALRPARLAGAVADWPHRIARLRSADELGRAARRRARQARHARGVCRMRARDRWRRALRPTGDWRRDLRTFAAGAGCGFLGGALLVATLLWQYHWIVPPWAGHAVGRAGTADPGARGIEAERPTATAGRDDRPGCEVRAVGTRSRRGPPALESRRTRGP